jgi:hypothetical protein
VELVERASGEAQEVPLDQVVTLIQARLRQALSP